jgi:DNA-binding transcriptional regulator YiaG
MTPEQFKQARLHLGVYQTELCALMGKCVRTIRSYESGEYPIPKSMELLINHLLKQKDQSNDPK